MIFSKKRHGNVAAYRIKDLKGNEVESFFTESEIQKVQLPNQFRIEKIINRKIRKGKVHYFVKWQGYSDIFNLWVKEGDLSAI